MNQPASREREPSAFAWIFSAVLAGAGIGAAIWGATKGRTSHTNDLAAPDETLTADAQQPPGGSTPGA